MEIEIIENEQKPNNYRDALGRFVVGNPGCPGKRANPRTNAGRIKEFAEANLEKTFRMIEGILDNEVQYFDVKLADKLKIIFELWNRAEGKVAQQLNITNNLTDPKDMNQLLIDEKLSSIDVQLQQLGVEIDD